MQFFLTKGLIETTALWSDIQPGYTWVHRAAHILTNDEQQKAEQVCQTYEVLLAEMEQAPTSSEALTAMLSTFRPRHHQLLAWPLSLLRSRVNRPKTILRLLKISSARKDCHPSFF